MTHDNQVSPDTSADTATPDTAAGDSDTTPEPEYRTDTDTSTRTESGTDTDTSTRTETETGPGSEARSSAPEDDQQLVPHETVMDFRARWEAIQQGFVDDPRSAVTDADALVSDVLEKLSTTFEEQHGQLEAQWNDGEPDTEDLRSALRRYRDFFDRLLAI
jgi:hypothetical protein